MSAAQFIHLISEVDEGVTVLCTGADVGSTSNLRCRFGNLEVAAKAESGGIISCCAPPREELDAAAVPLKVLDQDDRVVAEETFDYVALASEGAKNGSCCAKATDAAQHASVVGDGAAGTALSAPAKEESRTDKFKKKYSSLKPFAIISLSYLLYTTTDGAIRMIVLLHAYRLGFTAFEVAIMFTAYELMGVFTNLAAGMMGARWGIKRTLLTGLTLQLIGISVLYAWQDGWKQEGDKWKAIVFVTCAQALCGIAKDLTKLGGKTVTKLVTPDDKQTQLFKLVALITGWKNSFKGIGYFIGSACVAYNYYFALGVLLALIVAAMPWAAVGLTSQLGRARKENLSLGQIFKQRYNVNVLSVSRFFLFGSRDMWFEVPLPFFLRDTLVGLGWSRPLTGLFLAVWIIVYGQVQSWTPQLVLQPLRQSPANKYVCVMWNMLLTAAPLMMAIIIQSSDTFHARDIGGMTAVMVTGLGLFCLLFAVNSSIHSYLIVRYADGDKVAMNIGFYYCANAMGRLTGTLVSGALYSYAGSSPVDGLAACFWASVGFSAISTVVEMMLRDNSGGLRLGPCMTCIAPPPEAEGDEAGGSCSGPGEGSPAVGSARGSKDVQGHGQHQAPAEVRMELSPK